MLTGLHLVSIDKNTNRVMEQAAIGGTWRCRRRGRNTAGIERIEAPEAPFGLTERIGTALRDVAARTDGRRQPASAEVDEMTPGRISTRIC
jgi:hypothetical protein